MRKLITTLLVSLLLTTIAAQDLDLEDDVTTKKVFHFDLNGNPIEEAPDLESAMVSETNDLTDSNDQQDDQIATETTQSTESVQEPSLEEVDPNDQQAEQVIDDQEIEYDIDGNVISGKAEQQQPEQQQQNLLSQETNIQDSNVQDLNIQEDPNEQVEPQSIPEDNAMEVSEQADVDQVDQQDDTQLEQDDTQLEQDVSEDQTVVEETQENVIEGEVQQDDFEQQDVQQQTNAQEDDVEQVTNQETVIQEKLEESVSQEAETEKTEQQQEQNEEDLNSDCIVVYSKCNFQGESMKACDDLAEMKNFKHVIHSISIPAGFTVTLYDKANFQGSKHTFSESQKCLMTGIMMTQLQFLQSDNRLNFNLRRNRD